MSGTLVSLTAQSVTIQGFQIGVAADMLTALQYIGGIGAYNYSGNVTMQNINGTLTWTLLINNATTNMSSFAVIGDWIILDNNALVAVCKQANFNTLYHT